MPYYGNPNEQPLILPPDYELPTPPPARGVPAYPVNDTPLLSFEVGAPSHPTRMGLPPTSAPIESAHPASHDSPDLSAALQLSSMLPAGAGVRSAPVGTGSVLAPEQDFTSAPPPTLPAPAAQTAPASSPSIRAVKMPDGKIVFTNRPEYSADAASQVSTGGGREIDRGAAVDEIRTNDRALSPTRMALSDMVRKSVERGIQNPGVGGGYMNADDTSDPSEYVQEARTGSLMDKLSQQTAIARMKSDLDVAQRSPEEQAALGTKEIQITEYMQRSAKPRLDNIRVQADEAIAMIPRITSDPNQQAEMRRRIESKRDNDIQDVMNILAIGSGIRPQPSY